MGVGWQAQKKGNLYGAFICFGIATLFGLQVIINLGVNTGLLPTKGLTLPFFSYGGSSLLICCVMVALVYRVSLEIAEDYIASESNSTVKAKARKKKVAQKQTAGKQAGQSKAVSKKAETASSADDAETEEYVTGFDAYVNELNGGRDD
jgi:cell division protein FtsW